MMYEGHFFACNIISIHAFLSNFFLDKNVIVDVFYIGTRPRRSGRSSLGSGGNEETSSLMSHLLLEEQENQREMRRIKDREKREANEALMAKLSEWEVEMFPSDVVKELRSIWEVRNAESIQYFNT